MDVTLVWIIRAGLVGGALSMLLAGLLTFTVLSAWIPRMVSYAVGVLLAVAFLDVLPEAFEQSSDAGAIGAVTLAGVLGFFCLRRPRYGAISTNTAIRACTSTSADAPA